MDNYCKMEFSYDENFECVRKHLKGLKIRF